MKNKYYLFIFILFVFFKNYIYPWEYTGQKNTFYYTIDFPDSAEGWYLVDDSQKSNAFFQNNDKNSFIEVTVYELKSASDSKALFDNIVKKFKMTGNSLDTVFCQYNAVRGNYEFSFKKNNFITDLVVFKDSYYFYVLMGYSYKKFYEEKKDLLSKIVDSCKIYYDNNVVYGNYKQKNKGAWNALAAQNSPIEIIKKTNVKNDEKYYFNAKWGNFKESFEFLKEDLIKAKRELSEIGEYTGSNWNGWGYYNINISNDPDHNFTFWKKFYQDMYIKNYYRINDVYDYFKELSSSKKYSAYELAGVILNFIQNIPYERPMNIAKKDSGTNILDYFTPNEVAEYKKGDCDSKALFLLIIYRRLGYDAILFHSSHYGHVMTGLNINATGKYLVHEGKKYYFVETTYPDWKIGDLPPNMNDINKWKVVPVK